MKNQIPKDWQSVKLGSVVKNFDFKRVPLSSIQRSKRQGNIPYYGASGIIDRVDNYLFNGEYLLISEDGENLKSRNLSIVFLVNGKFWVNNHAHIVKAGNGFDNKLIYYWFSKNSLSPYITGSAQPKLNQDNLNSIEILWPSRDEREKIVDVLSSFDNKIEINNKIAKNLEEMAQVTFKEWFVKGSSSKPTRTFNTIATIIKGKKPKETFSLPLKKSQEYLLIESFMGNKKQYTSEKNLTLCDDNEPVIVMDGSGSGKVFTGKKGIVGSTLAVVKAKNGFESHKFFILFMIKKIGSQIRLNLTGSAVPHSDRGFIEKFPIYIPEEPIIKQFNIIISPILDKQKIIRDENENLVQLRDLILPKLMKGEIRV